MFLRLLRASILTSLLVAASMTGCGRSDLDPYNEDLADAANDARAEADVRNDVDARDARDGDADARQDGDARDGDADARQDGDARDGSDGDAADGADSNDSDVFTCGSQTCKGCCDGNTCVDGIGDGQCGVGGAQCANCLASQEVCFPSGNGLGGTCGTIAPKCDATSCPTGCCFGDQCLMGDIDAACGTGGKECTNCTVNGDRCSSQACVPVPPVCGPNNCAGCCDDMGVCRAGFADTRCGSSGNLCADCSGQGSTCNANANPRVCRSLSTCPSAYLGCNGASTPKRPITKGLCTSLDLADARNACAGGANSSVCNSFFQQLAANGSTADCAKCLVPFKQPLQSWEGIHECVSSFVDDACNGQTGCFSDCVDSSCSSCGTAGQRAVCDNRVRGNECSSYLNNSFPCVITALFGNASVCSPLLYQNNFGAWLQGVGGTYCGP